MEADETFMGEKVVDAGGLDLTTAPGDDGRFGEDGRVKIPWWIEDACAVGPGDGRLIHQDRWRLVTKPETFAHFKIVFPIGGRMARCDRQRLIQLFEQDLCALAGAGRAGADPDEGFGRGCVIEHTVEFDHAGDIGQGDSQGGANCTGNFRGDVPVTCLSFQQRWKEHSAPTARNPLQIILVGDWVVSTCLHDRLHRIVAGIRLLL